MKRAKITTSQVTGVTSPSLLVQNMSILTFNFIESDTRSNVTLNELMLYCACCASSVLLF